jgi:thiol-disulfide isomerase/thioredoxin
MKAVTLMIFLIFSNLSYCQNYSERELDSLLAIQNKKIQSNKEIINKPFPPFIYVSNGDTISNTSILGKAVFINFWSEGCPPCIAEFDALSEMHQLLKNHKNTDFVTFTFESDDNIEKIRKKYNLEYKIVSVTRTECYRLNNNNGFPTSMIIDKSGNISWISSGGQLEKDKVRKFIIGYVYPKILKML